MLGVSFLVCSQVLFHFFLDQAIISIAPTDSLCFQPSLINCLCIRNSQDGSSEEFIGEWVEARGYRDQVVIATKVFLLPTALHLQKLSRHSTRIYGKSGTTL
jgi:hypothetical protein